MNLRGPFSHLCSQAQILGSVPAEQVADLQTALTNHQRFQELVKHYVQVKVEETRAQRQAGSKKDGNPHLLLAQDPEVQQLMGQFQSPEPDGVAVQPLEVLVRTAIFKPATALGVIPPASRRRAD